MSRPLRLEFPGAVYHVTSRGDRREPIYVDDEDRRLHLDVLAQAAERFDAQVLAYCQMGNHYHLVLHTRQANLSRLMRHLNGVYTQAFNRRHGLVGHLFQGRFKAILVDREAYLLSLCRYVELNPVAAHLVAHAVDWTWSSAQAHLGLTEAPPWLDTQGLHAFLLGRPVRSLEDRQLAIAQYADLLQQALDTSFWNQGLRQQVYLGSEAFVAAHQAELSTRQRQAPDVPRQQRQVFLTAGQALDAGLQAGLSRDEALYRAYTEAGCTMVDLAQALNLSVSRVSRIVAKVEATRAGGAGLTRP